MECERELCSLALVVPTARFLAPMDSTPIVSSVDLTLYFLTFVTYMLRHARRERAARPAAIHTPVGALADLQLVR
jgi:hypothetical protein